MGFRGRYKNKRDRNEGEVVAALEAHGIAVVRADTPVDLICGCAGQTYLVEVKDGAAKLTRGQEEFLEKWTGHAVVVRSVEEAIEFAKEVRT